MATSTKPKTKLVVLGSGVMGQGIVATAANNPALEVVVLDIKPKDYASDPAKYGHNPNFIADSAVRGMIERDQKEIAKGSNGRPWLMSDQAAGRIATGNMEDDFGQLLDADIVIETIIEKAEIKQALFERIDKDILPKNPDLLIASNSSTVELHRSSQNCSAAFKARFGLMHFNNPVPLMMSCEMVATAQTDKAAAAALNDFAQNSLGKVLLHGKDVSGFIANRIGCFWWETGIEEAMKLGLSINEADAAVQRAGIPSTGVFGLIDLINHETAYHLSTSMQQHLPPKDGAVYGRIYEGAHSIPKAMFDQGYVGRKSGSRGGYYLIEKKGEDKIIKTLDIQAGGFDPQSYAERALPQWESLAADDLKALMNAQDAGGRYVRTLFLKTFAHAAAIAHEIAHDISAIDQTMRLSFGWANAPFEMMDDLGIDWVVQAMEAEKIAVPAMLVQMRGQKMRFYKTENGLRKQMALGGAGYEDIPPLVPDAISLAAVKKAQGQPLLAGQSASLHDIGDGVVCLELHSNDVNAIDPSAMKIVNDAIRFVEGSRGQYRAMVIYNEGKQFCAGANVALMQEFERRNDGSLEGMLFGTQEVITALKYASFPTIAAVYGAVLGGGLELVKACAGVVAKPITKSALVEANIGLVPGWLGVYETLVAAFARAPAPEAAVRLAYNMLTEPQMSRSAETAIDNLSLPLDTKIVMNKARLLTEGKATALSKAAGYTAPQLAGDAVSLPDETLYKALAKDAETLADAGKIKPHDYVVRLALLNILSGGGKRKATRSEIAYLERTTLAALLRTQGGKAAIDRNLFKGKDGLTGPATKEAALADYKAQWDDAARATPKDDLTGAPLPDDAHHKGRAKMDDLAQKADAFLTASIKK